MNLVVSPPDDPFPMLNDVEKYMSNMHHATY